MQFAPPLVPGRFVRRYKRFFMDFLGKDGETRTAHCPNTGALLGCLREGAAVLVQPTDNPKRSLRYSWKLVQICDAWVGVDTGLAVPLVREAIQAGLLNALADYPRVYSEVRYGIDGTSRIDLLLSRGGQLPAQSRKRPRLLPQGDDRVYVEVKNTTLAVDGVAMFPDAVTLRGQKHLRELCEVVAGGQRAAMVFCVQRTDCRSFRPADHIDPTYGAWLRQAQQAGVELYAFAAASDGHTLEPQHLLPVLV